MLCESRVENLKIIIAPLNVKLSSLKPTGFYGLLTLRKRKQA